VEKASGFASRKSFIPLGILVIGSDHDIHVERPELVIQAVRRVYDAAHNAPIKQFDAGEQLQ
jgi:hypothetical protein